MSRLPFWSDAFDGDLYRLLPEAEAWIAPLAARLLWVHGGVTKGRLNHPSAWHTNDGLTAFFTIHPGKDPRPGTYFLTQDPLVECTVEEALRDLIVHQLVMVVDGEKVADFNRITRHYFDLLFHARGHGEADRQEEARSKLQKHLKRVLNNLARLVGEPAEPVEEEVEEEVGYQEWLEECAKTCDCCPFCEQVPCDGCCAGGMCDGLRCTCEEEEDGWEGYDEPE